MSQPDHPLVDKLQQYLKGLKEDDQDRDWLRDMAECLLKELLEREFTQFLGAEPYERSDERQGYRNGYRSRELVTRVGRLWLRVSRDRERRFSTDLFERYQRSERALVLASRRSTCKGSRPGR